MKKITAAVRQAYGVSEALNFYVKFVQPVKKYLVEKNIPLVHDDIAVDKIIHQLSEQYELPTTEKDIQQMRDIIKQNI